MKMSNYNYLKEIKKPPRIRGVNSFYNLGIIEKAIGKKDAQTNQICSLGDGHITPYIDNKSRLFHSYLDGVFLKTALHLQPIVKEANALAVEFAFLISKNIDGIGENVMRESAKKEKQSRQILVRIAEIKAESDMVNEALMHHLEQAEGIFYSKISKYWQGVLSSAADELEHVPLIEEKEHVGRDIYYENRKKLLSVMEEVLRNGGAYDEV